MNKSTYMTVENPMEAVFKYLSISIVFMFVGFLFGKLFVPASLVYAANIFVGVLIVGLLLFSLLSRKNVIPRSFSMNFVYLFTFVDGILMYPILTYYLYDLGTTLFMNVVLGTCVLFALLALISHRKPAGHYVGLGSTLFVMSVVNIFIQGTVFNIAVSALGIIIFSAYILYDVSLLKYDIESGGVTCKNDLSIHVLNLYLDFINILLDLLRIVSDLTD